MKISGDHLRKTLLELISFNSFHPNDRELQAYILQRLARKNIKYQQDAFENIIAYLPGRTDSDSLMLNTHIDIPENTPRVHYTESATEIRGTGETILGADPKTGLAILLELADWLSENSPENRAPIEIVLTRCEEQGLMGARQLDISMVSAKKGLVIDQDGPITEVVVQAPAIIQFEGYIYGQTAHPRTPSDGVNALQILADAISKAPLGFSDDSQRVTWNVGITRSGTARNSIPGKAYFKAELRSFDEKFLWHEANRIKEIFANAAVNAGGRLEAEMVQENKAYQLTNEHPLIKQLEQTYHSMQLSPRYFETFGASDANIFNARGIHTVPVGSGYYNAHQYTEIASLTDMQQIAEFLIEFSSIA